MAQAEQDGWSLRAVGRAAGLSLGSVRNLMRAELGLLEPGGLGPADVLCVRVLAELGANRSTNRGSLDERTAGLLRRDREAVEVVRRAYRDGLDESVRLLVCADRCWVTRKDLEVLNALDAQPRQSLRVLPLGCWAAELTDTAPPRASRAA